MKTKKSKFSKRLIILVILLNVIFVAVSFFVLWDKGFQSPSLTAAWFGFTTTELLAIAGIKVVKTKTPPNAFEHFNDDIASEIDTKLGGDSDEVTISDEEC